MSTLYSVLDPMCSWCWGFAPERARVLGALPTEVGVRTVMGGLAPDTEEPMPPELREYVQRAWRAVAARTGARFDFAFWDRNTPRRSTYPACRAVLAAAVQGADAGEAMYARIQRAYYLESRNPSDLETLDALAEDLAPVLDPARFRADLRSPAIDARLCADLELAARLGVTGFPTLVLEHRGECRSVCRGYAPAAEVLAEIESLLSASG